VSFLDDDNGLKPNHISSLVDLIEFGFDLVHSQRTIVFPNGDLFEGNFLPWARDEESNARAMEYFWEKGIYVKGSPIMFDRISEEGYAKFGICVDTSEWLAKTEICRKVPFRTEIYKEDEAVPGHLALNAFSLA